MRTKKTLILAAAIYLVGGAVAKKSSSPSSSSPASSSPAIRKPSRHHTESINSSNNNNSKNGTVNQADGEQSPKQHWVELGCFKDQEDRVLPNKLGTDYETLDTCQTLAREAGYSMLGLEWGGECWAANEFKEELKADSADCNVTCHSNNDQMCGNDWRMNVYYLSDISKPAAATSDDPCGKLVDSPGKVFGLADAFTCYNSFSLFPEVRQGQIETLKRFLNFYAFLDISKSSGDPYFSSDIDLFQKLDEISADNSISTEFAFHSRISALFRSLNDPHTTYDASCFINIRFNQPWVLVSKFTGASPRPEIHILGTTTKTSPSFAEAGDLSKNVDKFWTDNGLDIEKYVGYKIAKIDGKDALEAIQARADANGGSRVPETRFNLQLASQIFSKGKFILNDGAFYMTSSPDASMSDSIQYDLVSQDGQDSVSVKVPWSAFVMPSAVELFANRDNLYQKSCVNSWSEVQQGTPPLPPSAGSVNFDPHRKPSQFGLKQVRPEAGKKSAKSWNEFAYDDVTPENQLLLTSLQLKSRLAAAKLKAKEKGSNPATRPNKINPRVDWRHASKVAMKMQYYAAKRLKNMVKPNGMLEDFDLSKPLVSDDNMAFYMIDDRTGVWSFPTVSPAASDEAGLANWMATFATGMSALEKAGAEFLLIDVTNNGGGIVCAGAAFAQYILPNIRFLSYDIRRSKPVEALLLYASSNKNIVSNSSSFSTADLLSSPDRVPFSGTDLVSKGPSYSRGRTLTPYTQKFENDCNDFTQGAFANLPQLQKGWAPGKIAIVSNGFCGSTCSNFVRVLREQLSIRSFVYGGASGKAFQPTSFEGGRLLSFDDLLLDSNEILWNASMDNGTMINGLRMNPGVAGTANQAPPLKIKLFKREKKGEKKEEKEEKKKDEKKNEKKKEDHKNDEKKKEDHKNDVKKEDHKNDVKKDDHKDDKKDDKKKSDTKIDTKNDKKNQTTKKDDHKSTKNSLPSDSHTSTPKKKVTDFILTNSKLIDTLLPLNQGPAPTPDSPQDNPSPPPRIPSDLSSKVLDALLDLPRELPRPISGSLAFWECYAVFGPITGMPLEWVPAPAEEYLTVADPLKVDDIWRAVAARMYANSTAAANGAPQPVQVGGVQKEVIGGETADASKKKNAGVRLSWGVTSILGLVIWGVLAA